MRIVLTGTGISQGVPVIGCPCRACRSRDPQDRRTRAAAVVAEGGTRIAIDIGPDFRQQMLLAEVTRLDAVIVTHEHSDHVAGLDDIRPFNWTMGCAIPLYAEPRVLASLRARFPYAFMPPELRYPGAPSIEEHTIARVGESFRIGEIEVTPLRVLHGELPILGYRMGKLAYITDCSALPQESVEMLRGVEVLVINALRHAPHPMHITLGEALELIGRVAPRRAYLTHISHDMGPRCEVAHTLPSHVELGYDGMVIAV